MDNIEKRNYLKSVIRGYAAFVNEKIDKYFSVFFKSGLTIEQLKNLPRPELNKLVFILRYLIDIEMNLTTNTLFLTNSLKRMQNKLTSLNESLKLNSSNDAVKREIELLTNKKNIFEMYDKFNVVSNPTESLSYASSRSKLCPEGKELNLKTGRCVKTKTQKVKKVKTPKVKTPKQKVEIKLDPVLVPVPVPEPVKQVSKVCPEGKELNLKTGRCIKVKIKTQKVKKVKISKMKTSKVTIPKVVIKLEPPPPPLEPEPKVALDHVKLDPEIKLMKSCPPGKELNLKTGRCIKVKTQKVKKIKKLKKTPKSCPEGKELNLKTGRCIKTKIKKVKLEKTKTQKQKIKE
jgi:hypothetical protein